MKVGAEGVRIPFWFDAYGADKNLHAVEKSEGGIKRRYLRGISSGIKKDGHGENVTRACIDYMVNQAQYKSIPMYEGQHGVNHTEDLGILHDWQITPTGEWITEFRLYDEGDGFERTSTTLERGDKLWRQALGLPPYVSKDGKPMPIGRGFSVEGLAPPGGILSVDNQGRRVIDKIDLDGVLCTPRPAYKDSTAMAIQKALGYNPTRTNFSVLKSSMDGDQYLTNRFNLDDHFNEQVDQLMRRGGTREDLDALLSDYASMLGDLIMSNPGAFDKTYEQVEKVQTPTPKSLVMALNTKLSSIMEQIKGRTI